MKPRPKRILCLSAFLLIGLMALLVWKPWIPSEPVYQGKTLTSWLELSLWGTTEDSSEPNGASRAEAEEAIRHIGMKGIPFLLNLMSSEEPAIKPWFRTNTPSSWHRKLGLEQPYGDSTRKFLGANGLAVLGTNAGAAVPELMKILSLETSRNPPDPDCIHLPFFVLTKIGSDAVPAIPLLIECLTNATWEVRDNAAHTLSKMRQKPEVVVPALILFLKLKNQPDRIGEEQTPVRLGLYGSDGSWATSALVSCLTNTDPVLRGAATNMLRQIDPLAADRAGVQTYGNR